MDDEDMRYMNESQKNRRVRKFFGERLDVNQPRGSSVQGNTKKAMQYFIIGH